MQKSYNHLIFILPSKTITFQNMTEQLEHWCQSKPNCHLEKMNDTQIVLKFDGNYCFYLAWNNADYVNIEAREIVENTVFSEDYSFEPLSTKVKNQLMQSTQRIEFFGDFDPNMDYFNTVLFVLGELEKMADVVILNVG